MLEVKLDNWDVLQAIEDYLKNKMGVDTDNNRIIDHSEAYVKCKESLDKYKEDKEWNGNEWIVKKEYKVEGLYVKRKNKKTGHISYKKHYPDKYHIIDQYSGNTGNIKIYLDSDGFYEPKESEVK
tara:strand:- start:255 stop:629 length:375 start_codon:yes stop_codon:yes gene_type:complete